MESLGLGEIEKQLKNTYSGSTVLITGHTGFKGGWLALWLESLGANVVGYSLDPPSSPSFFQATAIKKDIEDIRGDILDFQKISDLICGKSPDFIFHLAAQPLVLQSYKTPAETFNTNIMGTVNILESIRVSGNAITCVCITSDKCYENKEWEYAYRENDPMGGYDPYSASKGAAEIVIASYRRSFFNSNPDCSISSARAGNIIGGGDWADDRLVPDSIRSLVKGEPIKIRNPNAIRPWQFILDPLLGYLWLGMKMKQKPEKFSGAWNFGPNYSNNLNVKSLTEKIVETWGYGTIECASDTMEKSHEANFLQLDIAKSVTHLGWTPRYSIDDAIQKTVDWYKVFYSKSGDMTKFSRMQIESFLSGN